MKIRSVLIALLVATASTRAASPEAVDAAIRKGVTFLYEKQTKQGNWERSQKPPPPGGLGGADDGQYGGRTALCTYALLAAGERAVDPRLTKAITWLRGVPMTGTYALGLRANVWFYAPQTPAMITAMQKDAFALAKSRSANPANLGLFTYQPGGYNIDLSCSQYGVLGCWAAAQRINAFDVGFWTLVEKAWHQQQNDDGGWSYTGRGGSSTIQMTAAGVASLLITQDFAHTNDDNDPKRADAGAAASGAIDRGLAWIGQNLAAHLQAPVFYALYGVERVGVASGQKYIGDIDWYNACADVLLKLQQPDGSWNGGDAWSDAEINTSFALLFLSRGREPVMVNKLDYDITAKQSGVTKKADWNLRPRDMANVTRWVEEQTERRLNWQIVKLSIATVDDLHDSNILYMTGKLPISLKDEEKAKLKQFVEEGGLIIASAEGGDRFFSRTFRTLGEELFPGNSFKTLTDGDGLPYSQSFVLQARKKTLAVEGLGNGARLLMLLIPDGDLSAIYQKRDTSRTTAYRFFSQAFSYSIEKTATRFKGQTYVVRPDPQATTDKTVTLTRLSYNGQWNPEPAGWSRVSAILRNQAKVDLQIKTAKLGTDFIDPAGIAHLTGTDALPLTDAERAAMKTYLDAGGLLVIDNCGGNPAFNKSVQEELTKLIPDAATQLLSPLPPEHELFHTADGKAIDPQYRPFALPTLGMLAKTFQIRGLAVNGKLAVLYSPQDLSVGLVGQPVDCVTGYTPETATALVRRIIELRAAGKL